MELSAIQLVSCDTTATLLRESTANGKLLAYGDTTSLAAIRKLLPIAYIANSPLEVSFRNIISVLWDVEIITPTHIRQTPNWDYAAELISKQMQIPLQNWAHVSTTIDHSLC